MSSSPLSSGSVRRIPPPNLATCSGLVEFARRGRAAPRSRSHPLQIVDLLPAPLVPAALDLRLEERVHDRLRELDPDDALAERQQIQAHMLDAVARRPLVVDDRGAHAGDLVRDDRGPDARTAAEDAPLVAAARDRAGEWRDDERVVVLGIVLRREVIALLALRAQVMPSLSRQAPPAIVRPH